MRLGLPLLVLLAACTPAPEKVCAHFEELDQSSRMPRFGEHELSNRVRPSKVPGCMRGLRELARVEGHAYRKCARCVLQSTTSADAWNCWVLDHLATNQAEEQTKLVACSARSERARVTCTNACTDAHCTSACSATYEDAIVACHLEP